MLQVILIFIYYFWEGRHDIQFLLLYWRHAFTKTPKIKSYFFCSFKDKRIGKPLVLSKNHLTHYLRWMELSYIYYRVPNEKQALMKDKRQRKAILMSITLRFFIKLMFCFNSSTKCILCPCSYQINQQF